MDYFVLHNNKMVFDLKIFQTEPKLTHLDRRYVFMFDVGMNIFIWTGKLAKGVTRTKTRQELLNAKSILIKVINLDDAQYPRQVYP